MKLHVGDLVRVASDGICFPFALAGTIGIIVSTEKRFDCLGKDSTDDDNVYVWLSQTEQKEYYFYEDEAAATNISAI